MSKKRIQNPMFLFFMFGLLGGALMGCSSKKDETAQKRAEDALIQYSFAFDFYQGGELIRARAAAKQSLELVANEPKTLNLLGLISFRLEDFAEAEGYFKKALAINAKLPDVWNNLGTLYYATERFNEAESALIEALQFPLYLYPENIYNNLGLVYLRKKDYAKATQNFEQAIRLRNSYFLPYQNLGKLYVETKNFAKARNALEMAIKNCPRCVEPRYFLGLSFLELNQEAKALEQFEKARELGPETYYGRLSAEFLLDKETSGL